MDRRITRSWSNQTLIITIWSAHPVFKEAKWIIMLLNGLPSSQQDHSEGFIPAAMPQRLNGPTRQCEVLHNIGSLQWLLVVPYSRRRCTENSLPNLVRAIQMGRDANGTDECASNIHADDE